jgi:hypothetical protein
LVAVVIALVLLHGDFAVPVGKIIVAVDGWLVALSVDWVPCRSMALSRVVACVVVVGFAVHGVPVMIDIVRH